MDNQGWIKLHRKILDNKELFGKNYDFALFTYFILKADRITGVARVGRQDLAKRFRADESTIYKAMKRIERGGLIHIKSNNQFSDVYICKYTEYQTQSNNESNNKVTTKEQQSNTIQEERSKNKEILLSESEIGEISKENNISKKVVIDYQTDYLLWKENNPRKSNKLRPSVKSWIRRDIKLGKLLQNKSLKDKIKEAGYEL